LTLADSEIITLITDYEKESKALLNEILKFCWYMRGGLTYTEAMALSQSERVIISKIIKENIEVTNKTGIPFF
jgi:hypothetical protein